MASTPPPDHWQSNTRATASASTPSPRHIATPPHADDNADALAARQPLGRLGSVADIVEGVRYLEAASFVPGEILHIDGGQSAGH